MASTEKGQYQYHPANEDPGSKERWTDSDDMDSEIVTSRQTWSKKTEYFLSVIGFCVGLGNIWRFPYVCMRNSGGAFLIPFFVSLFVCGLPVYFLEVALGQFSGKGPLHAWNICPLFKGIGVSMNVLCLIVAWYYSMIMSWCLIFMVNSFKSPPPWTLCGQSWNTDSCVVPKGFRDGGLGVANSNNSSILYGHNVTGGFGNLTGVPGNNTSFGMNALENKTRITSTEEFWHHNVLELSSGLDELGGIPWHTAVALIASNTVVLLALIKGIGSSGKVVYVTATLPYILLAVILILGCTLPGSGDGILFYIKPDFEKLLLVQTWVEAAIQVFYSLGPAWGCLVTMASYNKFKNNCLRDSILLTVICEGTSVFGGFAIFSILGHMAYVLQVPIMDFAKSGAGLAFIVYPEAISYLPVPQLWGFLFFLMLFSLGLDSLFANVETLTTTIADMWPEFMRRWRIPVTIGVMGTLTIAGLLFTARGGAYVFQIVDWYIAAFTLFIQSALECVVIAWIYGSDRFSYDVSLMVGKKPSVLIMWSLKLVTPVLLMILFFVTLAFYEPPTFAGYIYPSYAEIFGWAIAIFPFLSILITSIVVLVKAEGSFMQRVRTSCKPPADWGPSNPEAKKKYHFEEVLLADSPSQWSHTNGHSV